ncbi:MAG TPA: hypothetical protein VMR50_22095 [Myxococcota bacterium]|nr:hypothetical protein [Myxococcota bacterium]
MRRGFVLALTLLCTGCAMFKSDRTRLAEWQDEAVSLRGLTFKHGVELSWVDESQMKDVLTDEAEDDLEPKRVAGERDALAAIGVLPPEIDLAKELLTLYASQVAGIYSQRKNTLFVNQGMAGGLQSLVLGPIMVHELTHALQDQHFPEVLGLLLNLDDEDDVGRALSGTVEGDATVTMLGALPGVSADQKRIEMAETVRDSMLKQLDDRDSDIGKAPRLLAVSLVFPYAYGTMLAAERWDSAGNAGLDAELEDPPLATLHLLQPGTRGPVDFVRLPGEQIRRAAGSSCTLDYSNVAGALLLRVLFEDSLAPAKSNALLAGWRGDRYLKLGCGDKWELLWLTRWKSNEAAQRFADAYRALAPGIAARTKLSGPAEVVVRDQTALVVTPGLRARADEWIQKSEVRSYSSFVDWVGGGCFPDEACPTRTNTERAGDPRGSDRPGAGLESPLTRP